MEMDTCRKSGIEEISNYAVRLQDKGDISLGSFLQNELSAERVIGHFRYQGEKFALVGGSAYNGGDTGLGYFNSYGGVSSADVGMLACKSKEIAEYVSTQFGKLVFDACFARHFKGEEFEWLD